MFGLGNLFPRKKKHPDAAVPPSRVKKIMKEEKTVGCMAASVPVSVERLMEHFAKQLTKEAGEVAKQNGAKMITPGHLKAVIAANPSMKFLESVVGSISSTDLHVKQKEVRDALSVRSKKDEEEKRRETEAEEALAAAKAELYGEIGISSSVGSSESPKSSTSGTTTNLSICSSPKTPSTGSSRKRKTTNDKLTTLKLPRMDGLDFDDEVTDDDRFVDSDGVITDDEDETSAH